MSLDDKKNETLYRVIVMGLFWKLVLRESVEPYFFLEKHDVYLCNVFKYRS